MSAAETPEDQGGGRPHPSRCLTGRDTVCNRELVRLLGRVAKKDKGAFERLYQLAGPRLFAVVRRMIAPRAAAEDVLQEAFLAIWRRAGQFEASRGEPMAWMTTIARHRSIDQLRRVGRQRLPDPTPIAASSAEHTALVRSCLDRINGDQRQAILLAYYHGMSHGEIADHLGPPVGTVKSRIRRGLAAMKNVIEP